MRSCEKSVGIWSEVKTDSTLQTHGGDGLREQVRVLGLLASR